MLAVCDYLSPDRSLIVWNIQASLLLALWTEPLPFTSLFTDNFTGRDMCVVDAQIIPSKNPTRLDALGQMFDGIGNAPIDVLTANMVP